MKLINLIFATVNLGLMAMIFIMTAIFPEMSDRTLLFGLFAGIVGLVNLTIVTDNSL